MKSPTAANPMPPAPEFEADSAIDAAIDAFLDGKSDGAEVFTALYGSVAEEPIPARLLAIVRGTTVQTDEARPSAKILPFRRSK
jgi:hypothetical protein